MFFAIIARSNSFDCYTESPLFPFCLHFTFVHFLSKRLCFFPAKIYCYIYRKLYNRSSYNKFKLLPVQCPYKCLFYYQLFITQNQFFFQCKCNSYIGTFIHEIKSKISLKFYTSL